MEWPGLDAIQRRIRQKRKTGNRNNLTRTEYYLDFWLDHQELPWALMAHLVSRNAGYQMTDVERYLRWVTGIANVTTPRPLLRIAPLPVAMALFALLETGNFLIYRDVCPALEIYRWARRFPDHGEEILPEAPGQTRRYRRLHDDPVPLPVCVADRPNHQEWLKPRVNPVPLAIHPVSAQKEIADPAI